MKIIKITQSIRPRIEEAGLTTEGTVAIQAAEANRAAVLQGAAVIESNLESIATGFFAREGLIKTLFREQIISSSWCSFDAKRKLALVAAEHTGFAAEADRKKLGKLLERIVLSRNIFIHGLFELDHGNSVWVAYFSRKPEKQELTDAWLGKVEERINAGVAASLALLDHVWEWSSPHSPIK